jgi:NADP-dependent 3-hydroxy acid dehydrogenase YdfG
VSRREQGDELVRRVESELGPLDVVASNAGVADWQPLVEVTDESFDRIVGVNLTGAFNVGQAAARAMVARGEGGRIVFTSSVHVQMPFPTMAVYGAMKQGVRSSSWRPSTPSASRSSSSARGHGKSMVGEVRHAFLGARDYARKHDGPGRAAGG